MPSGAGRQSQKKSARHFMNFCASLSRDSRLLSKNSSCSHLFIPQQCSAVERFLIGGLLICLASKPLT